MDHEKNSDWKLQYLVNEKKIAPCHLNIIINHSSNEMALTV